MNVTETTDILVMPGVIGTADGENPAAKEEKEDEEKKQPTLGSIIKHLRIQANLTQIQLAKAVGYKTAEWTGMIEGDHRTIDLDRLPKMAHILGVNANALIVLVLRQYSPRAAAVLFGAPAGSCLPTQEEDTHAYQLSAGAKEIGENYDNLGPENQRIASQVVEALLHAGNRR